MPTFDASKEPINVLNISDTFLFCQYFDSRDLYNQLSDWYNDENYRFEVARKDWDQVKIPLQNHYYDPVIIEDPIPYCVVMDRSTRNEEVLRNSVYHLSRRGYRYFIMKDQIEVDKAIENGAEKADPSHFEIGGK